MEACYGVFKQLPVNELGDVQQFQRGKWISLTVNTGGPRAEVRLRGLDGKQKRVGVFRLLDRCFCGGYADKNGLCAIPKNGVKSECTLENLSYKALTDITSAGMFPSDEQSYCAIRSKREHGAVQERY